MFLLWVAHALAVCPATSGDLVASLEVSEQAFGSMDIAAFLAATNRATAEANCLSEAVPRSTIARLHRVEGLRAFVDKDADRAARAFASARSIEPAYTFPEALVPSDHPVRTQYATLDPTTGGAAALPTPAAGYFTVDGRTTASRPQGRPVLVQLVGGDGGVSRSQYLWPDEPLFQVEAAPGTTTATAGTTTTGTTTTGTTTTGATTTDRPPKAAREPGRGPNLPLALLAGGALVAAGVGWGLAADAHGQWEAASQPADLESLRTRTNTWFFVAVGSSAATAGLAAGAVIAGQW